MIKVLLVLGIGYLAGCFQTAYIIGKTKQHIDIRQYGSGNSGTTNALRVMGLKLGALTFAGDFLKGLITVLAVLLITGQLLLSMVAGLGVILGHDFPVFLNFKGGKGIASTLGIAFALDYRMGLLAMGLMIVIIYSTKYVSVASLMLCLCLPICFWLFQRPGSAELILMVIIAALGIFQHRENIMRLAKGQENKINFHKKS